MTSRRSLLVAVVAGALVGAGLAAIAPRALAEQPALAVVVCRAGAPACSVLVVALEGPAP